MPIGQLDGTLYNSRNIGAGNSSFYRNARFDELTDKALVLTEQEERRPLYEEASRILVEDAAGLFIYNTKWFGPFTKKMYTMSASVRSVMHRIFGGCR